MTTQQAMEYADTMHEFEQLVHYGLQKFPVLPVKSAYIINNWRTKINTEKKSNMNSSHSASRAYLRNRGYCPTIYIMFEAMQALLLLPR